jgi:hypothetical protein
MRVGPRCYGRGRPDARHARYSIGTIGAFGDRTTFPVATSNWAVVMTLWEPSTLGMHPRIS